MKDFTLKVIIGLVILCALTGIISSVGGANYAYEQSSLRGTPYLGFGTIPEAPTFYPGGHECYYGGQCGQTQTSCQQVCTQQCVEQPPCCSPVCTEQCVQQPPVCTPVCNQVCTPVTQTSGYGSCMYGGCTGYGYGGGYCPTCCDYCGRYQSYNRVRLFANETEIEDVSGEWETDIFGALYMKLTGDDILRAMYEVNGNKGYMQGDFTGNSTPNVIGVWWQEPTFQLFNNAGGFSMTFDFEEGTMEGVYAYGDGTWTPFTGEKVAMELSEEQDDALYNMPEYNGEISEEIMPKVIDAPNPINTNPINAEET